MPLHDHYNTLGVAQNIPQDALKRKFRKLAKQYHPDLNPSPNAREEFVRINLAMEVLGNPASRRKYDRLLALGARVRNPSASTAQKKYQRKNKPESQTKGRPDPATKTASGRHRQNAGPVKPPASADWQYHALWHIRHIPRLGYFAAGLIMSLLITLINRAQGSYPLEMLHERRVSLAVLEGLEFTVRGVLLTFLFFVLAQAMRLLLRRICLNKQAQKSKAGKGHPTAFS